MQKYIYTDNVPYFNFRQLYISDNTLNLIMKTIDDVCNEKRGTFKKFIEEKEAKLSRYYKWEREAKILRKQGKPVPEFGETIDLAELT